MYTCMAAVAFGLETLVAEELKKLGYSAKIEEGGRVIFDGDALACCRANLFLRCAERIFIRVGNFRAESFEQLFEGTKSLLWEQFLSVDAQFPVRAKSVKSKLFSLSDCQAIVKKAIVERLKTRYHQDWFAETGSVHGVEVSILKDEVSLSIDTSGTALHKRGYRTLTSEAPLTETMAAALVKLSRYRHTDLLIDPMCGSGTILVEAAMMAKNMAPGLRRTFDGESFPLILPVKAWETAREEAQDLVINNVSVDIRGFDVDAEVLGSANYHAKQAGVADAIQFKRQDIKDFSCKEDRGLIITNPPYGERLGQEKEAETLYRILGKVFKQQENWALTTISPHADFERFFGKRADKRRKVYNGRIECQILQYYWPKRQKTGIEKDE